jgi:hypothetical protein
MPDIWIGAKNDELQGITTPATIDNLWIFGRKLTDVEIAQAKIGIWPDGEPQIPEQQRDQDPEAAAEMARQQNELERLRREAGAARNCSSDDQCAPSNGFTGACYSISGSTATCYQRCDRDDDCNSGIQCLSVTLPAGTLDGVCVPD